MSQTQRHFRLLKPSFAFEHTMLAFVAVCGTSVQKKSIHPMPALSIFWQSLGLVLKAVDTIGNCQRLDCSVGVSQHMHKITNLRKCELNWSSKLQENNGRKNTLVVSCVLSDARIWHLSWGLEFNSNIFVRNYFFLKYYATSEGAVSHYVLYYQQVFIARF